MSAALDVLRIRPGGAECSGRLYARRTAPCSAAPARRRPGIPLHLHPAAATALCAARCMPTQRAEMLRPRTASGVRCESLHGRLHGDRAADRPRVNSRTQQSGADDHAGVHRRASRPPKSAAPRPFANGLCGRYGLRIRRRLPKYSPALTTAVAARRACGGCMVWTGRVIAPGGSLLWAPTAASSPAGCCPRLTVTAPFQTPPRRTTAA